MSEGIAIVGLACRYPDARSPAELWETVMARRRAFRRLPEERLRLADYRAAPGARGTAPGDPGDPDSVSLHEAAVLEGWEFDRVRFRVAGATFRVTDLTHWLALEVAAEALADGGFAAGAGLPRDTTGALVGNSLTGEFARAQLMRLRWPYVRRVLGEGLAAAGWPDGRAAELLDRLERSYKRPFPEPSEESLAGGLSNTIAGRICNHFDLHGGGFTVDGACASSLLAVAQSCSALAAGDLDVALAGGVDLSLDPFELVGFARAGALASGEMRVYDRRSAGFLPGEGCGFAVLMREGDARAQGRRIHAVIRGWGISSDGHGGISRPEAAGQRLALDRAYRRAGCGIETVALFEGHGTGTAVGDATELQALSQALRAAGERGNSRKALGGAAAGRAAEGGAPAGAGESGRPTLPALGSVKANIGHTKAAAGIAGLLKAVMAVASQTLPPTTGCDEPHPELTGAGATWPVLRVLDAPEPWPEGRPLRAGVSAMGFGGVNAHLVIEGMAPTAATAEVHRTVLAPRERALAAPPQDAELFVLGAAGRAALTARVRRLAEAAPRLSRAELGDLAAALARALRRDRGAAEVAAGSGSGAPAGQAERQETAAGAPGPGAPAGRGEEVTARAAIVAATPDELAARAAVLAGWLAEGVTGRLDQRQGVFLGISGSAAQPPRVGLLFTGQGSPAYGDGAGGALRRRFAELAVIYELSAAANGVPEGGDEDAGHGGHGEPACHRTAADVRCSGSSKPAGEVPDQGGPGASEPRGTAAGQGVRDATGARRGAADDGGSSDTAVAQPAIVRHSQAGLWLLERLGVEGSVAVGHSLGEITALCWAGACDAAAALRLAAARGRAMAERGEPGAMASLDASPETAGELLEGIGSATIAAFNGAHRTVVSGSPEEVTALLARAAARGVTATRLRVARAFHSPRVAAAAHDLAGALAPVAWQPLRRPVVSTVEGVLLAPEADLPALLLRQVTSPVRFTAALAAARPLADLWIEVGPGRAVADLAGDAVGGPVLCLDAGGPSLGPAWGAAGALFAAGVPIDLDPLFAGRFTRPFDLDRPLKFLANPCESAPLPAAGDEGETAVAARAPRDHSGESPGPRPAGAAAAVPIPRAAAGSGPFGLLATAGGAATAGREGAARDERGDQTAWMEGAEVAPLAVVRALVAARAELPESAVRDDSRLLADLHLNSISVGQLVVEASRRLGLAAPASPTDYAQATVAQMAQALAERAGRERPGGAAGEVGAAPQPAAAPPPGVDSWVRPFVVALTERPLPSFRAAVPVAAQDPQPGAGAWQVVAPSGHPLAAPIAAALQAAAPAGEAPAILLCLPANLGEGAVATAADGARTESTAPAAPAAPAPPVEGEGRGTAAEDGGGERALELFVATARAAAGPLGLASLVVVQHQGGGGGFARTVRLELPAADTWVIDLPTGVEPERAASWVAAEVAAHRSAPAAGGDAATATSAPSPREPGGGVGEGVYVEAHYDRHGVRRVPVLRLLPPATAPGVSTPAARDAPASQAASIASPAPAATGAVSTGESAAGLGPQDVLLVTGGGKGIGAECALALARESGCRLAILGRSDPETDPELAANLARMAASGTNGADAAGAAGGVRPLYLRCDVADRRAVLAAVGRVAAELGPVTALLHAAGRNEPRRLADLDLAGLRRILAPKLAGAENLLAVLQDPRLGRLRLAVAFGSIIARTGLHGEAEYAIANEWLERRLARFAAAHPACRCLVLDWSVWSGTGMGERLGTMEALRHQGIDPIPIDAGIAELRRLLADPAVAGSVVVTGRFGNPPTLEVERAPLPLLRFLERPRVHVPGVELVADTEISAESDPYLADHVFRGEPLFAAVLGLEAMAQAAAAVTGARGLPVFEQVELRRPVAVAAGRATTLRLAALVRAPGLVEVALRDSATGFAADHFRAFCRFPAAPQGGPAYPEAGTAPPAAVRSATGAGAEGSETARLAAVPILRATLPSDTGTRPVADGIGAASGRAGGAAGDAGRTRAGTLLPLDPARDLYGSILFHTGRFRRLGGFRELRATECLAEIVPDGAVSWFGRYMPPALLLGDPAARDAAIHGIQACIPHAQLLPTGVERITTGRIAADEPLLLAARERERDGDRFVYDLDILAADGSVRERWQGLALRAVDRTRLPAAWSAPLLAPYLERRLQELLADPGLRVRLEPGGPPHPGESPGAPRPEVRRGASVTARLDSLPSLASQASLPSLASPTTEIAVQPAGLLTHRPDGRPEIPGGPPLSLAHAGGLVLAVLGSEAGPEARIGCDLEPVTSRTAEVWRGLLGDDRAALAGLIARQQGETSDAAATRVWTAAESLQKAGSPAGTPLLLEEAGEDGWLLLRAGGLRVATFTAELRELGGPCALAVALPAAETSPRIAPEASVPSLDFTASFSGSPSP